MRKSWAKTLEDANVNARAKAVALELFEVCKRLLEVYDPHDADERFVAGRLGLEARAKAVIKKVEDK